MRAKSQFIRLISILAADARTAKHQVNILLLKLSLADALTELSNNDQFILEIKWNLQKTRPT